MEPQVIGITIESREKGGQLFSCILLFYGNEQFFEKNLTGLRKLHTSGTTAKPNLSGLFLREQVINKWQSFQLKVTHIQPIRLSYRH
jgi:hypothetical protein